MRWLEPEQTAAPTMEPVSLAAGLSQCRLDADDDAAADIPGYIAAARRFIEDSRGVRLVDQGVTFRAWGFDDAVFRLPLAPVTEVTAITYLDPDGVRQTLDPSVYDAALYGLDPTIAKAFNQIWPPHRCQLGSVVITARVGYPIVGQAVQLPEAVAEAIKLIIGDWNANREQSADGRITAIPMVAVDSLLTNFRGPYA